MSDIGWRYFNQLWLAKIYAQSISSKVTLISIFNTLYG